MAEVLGLLKESGFTFEKKFGQNFLTDTNLLRAIAADGTCPADGSGPSDGGTVLEIGCGAGTLTRELSLVSGRVVGFEIDRRLEPVLAKTLADCGNVELRFADFMKEDLAALESELRGPYRVVANLPYYITTPILMKILEESASASSVTVMVQEEVADRLCAPPGSPEYGAITVAVNLIGSAKITRRVSRKLFTPPPNVDSAVVRVDIDETKRERFADPFLRKVARCSFAMRRKTLANNLSAAFGFPRERIAGAIAACGFPPAVRGETLSAEEFVRLSAELRGAK